LASAAIYNGAGRNLSRYHETTTAAIGGTKERLE